MISNKNICLPSYLQFTVVQISSRETPHGRAGFRREATTGPANSRKQKHEYTPFTRDRVTVREREGGKKKENRIKRANQ